MTQNFGNMLHEVSLLSNTINKNYCRFFLFSGTVYIRVIDSFVILNCKQSTVNTYMKVLAIECKNSVCDRFSLLSYEQHGFTAQDFSIVWTDMCLCLWLCVFVTVIYLLKLFSKIIGKACAYRSF